MPLAPVPIVVPHHLRSLQAVHWWLVVPLTNGTFERTEHCLTTAQLVEHYIQCLNDRSVRVPVRGGHGCLCIDHTTLVYTPDKSSDGQTLTARWTPIHDVPLLAPLLLNIRWMYTQTVERLAHEQLQAQT